MSWLNNKIALEIIPKNDSDFFVVNANDYGNDFFIQQVSDETKFPISR